MKMWMKRVMTTKMMNRGPFFYHSLLAVHKFLAYLNDINSNSEFLKYNEHETPHFRIETLFKLMQHNHMWVRKAASRLVGQCLSAAPTGNSDSSQYFSSDDSVFELVKVCCSQLTSDILDDDLADQVTKNLIWGISQFHAANNAKGKNWLIHRLSYLSRKRGKGEVIRRATCFKCIGFLATQMEGKEIEENDYLVPMMSSLVRFKDEALPRDVLELLESRVGSVIYLQGYKAVQQQVQKIRDERKKKYTMEKIEDPHAAAKRKLQKTQQKKAAKKRKIAQAKKLRGR
mmetsp:Transcript_15278/g.18903  ORF Transcript_15278/g.18903 Transcript_15278/m.18903 type:complete len:287 (+) Transcript_15278:168-1028(+)